jgi:hypothetical protein
MPVHFRAPMKPNPSRITALNDYGNETNVVCKIPNFIVLLCFAPSNILEVIVRMKRLQGLNLHGQNNRVIKR